MKRFLLFLLLAIAACSSHAQSPITRYLGYPKEISFFEGIVKVDSGLYGPIRDTNFVPLRVGGQVYRSADSSIYVSISVIGPKKWQRLGSGSLVSSPTPWGQIPGNIADQADLATALEAKQNILPFGDYTQYIGGDQNLYNFHDGVVAITDPTYSKIGHTHSPNDILGLLDYIHNALTVTGNATYNASTGVLNVTGGGTGSYTFASPMVNDGSGHISIPSIDASLITSGTKSHTFINDFDAYSRSLYSALLPLGYNQATGVFSVDTTNSTYGLATKPYVANYVATHTGGTAGGDLSGTYPNPTVAQFNGQLPSYYLNRSNHTGTQLSSTISDFTTAVQTVGDARYPQISVSYSNPSWIQSLAVSKITGLKAIDSVWRKVGSDSVFYRMNGLNYFAFHDSIGTTGGGSYTFQYSLSNTGGVVNLVGETATPGANMAYSTDASGARGFHSVLTGTLGSRRNNWLFAYDSLAGGYKLIDPSTLTTGGGIAGVNILNNGTTVNSTARPTLNLIPSGNTSITAVDNSGSNRVDITFSSIGGTGTYVTDSIFATTVGSVNEPQNGDSTFTTPGMHGRYPMFYRERTLQVLSRDYTFDSSTGKFVCYPPLTAGEAIYIVGRSYTNFGTSSLVTTQNGGGTVGSGQYQAESQAFFTRAEAAEGATLPTTFKNAYDAMVVSLKSAGVYSKLRALYVYPGATAAAHALNAISSSFTLTFIGSMTHSSSGVTWTGGYANSNLTPSTSGMSGFSRSYGFFNRTTTPRSGSQEIFELAAKDGASSDWHIYTGYGSPSNSYGVLGIQINAGAVTDVSGFWVMSQTSGDNLGGSYTSFFKSGVKLGSTTNNNTQAMLTQPLYIMAYNNQGTVLAGSESQFNVPLHFIGDGLTDADNTNFYNAVNTFLSAIGR